jgi:ubiquitin C-terminal hydrolase
LVLQLKRFSYGKWRKEKINTRVSFPDELDLCSFTTESKDQSVSNSRYTLVGVVNHSGGIDFGHYTA